MPSAEKRPSPDLILREATALRAIFLKRQTEFNFSQTSFARECGISSQQVVYQYLSGYLPLNLKTAVKFSRYLLCSVRDFSPRIADELESLGLTVGASSAFAVDNLTPKERRLVEFYRSVGPEAKHLLCLWVESYLSQQKQSTPTHVLSTLLEIAVSEPTIPIKDLSTLGKSKRKGETKHGSTQKRSK